MLLLILYTTSNVHDPRALAAILHKAEADLASMKHPDPYIGEFGCLIPLSAVCSNKATAPSAPGGTKWCVSCIYLKYEELTDEIGNAIFL
jgi:hypothetical protein